MVSFVTDPSACEYLPSQIWQLRYDVAERLTPVEYAERLQRGWRRFGVIGSQRRCRAVGDWQAFQDQVLSPPQKMIPGLGYWPQGWIPVSAYLKVSGPMVWSRCSCNLHTRSRPRE